MSNVFSGLNGVFPEKNGTFSEFSKFGESLKHELVSLKDLLCYQCPCGTERECPFLTQNIPGLSTAQHSNDIILVTEFVEFSENTWEKLE